LPQNDKRSREQENPKQHVVFPLSTQEYIAAVGCIPIPPKFFQCYQSFNLEALTFYLVMTRLKTFNTAEGCVDHFGFLDRPKKPKEKQYCLSSPILPLTMP
jgi:hypothetical protein